MTQKLRVTTLGNGYFSQFHHRAWRRIPEVALVATCDRDGALARQTADEFDIAQAFDQLETMLDTTKVDLLDIIAPPIAHLGAIKAAAARGVDVICQKPFCGDLATAQQAVEIARAAGIKLIVHENFRFQPWHQAIAELLASGELGAVYSASFRLRPGDGGGPDAYLARQPYFRDMKRFMVHETGIHIVDVFRFLFGEVRTVSAKLRRLNPVIAGEDAGLVVLEMDNGVLATLDANRLSDHPAQNRRLTMGEMLIEAEGGSISLNGDGDISIRKLGENQSQPLSYIWRNEDFGGDCVFRLQRAVVDCLLGDLPPVNLAAAYLNNLRIEDAIYESDQQGRTIAVFAA
jgi:D-apiose dehydrogenase